MEFRIADTFSGSLARLTGDEQKAVKTTAFDLQLNPASPGMQFHRLDKSRDRNFWSVRVNRDIRIIVHRTDESLLLCYVAHHDDAYDWARRRKLEVHPQTGAAQLVEIREMVKEVVVPRYVQADLVLAPKPLFDEVPPDDLLAYGVPAEWLADVRAATDETILQIAEHLPAEAAEAILNLAVGIKPQPVAAVDVEKDAFEHPDARRRFRVIANAEELERALAYPWDRWSIFLHPAQREAVEHEYAGPARVAGSAGTGKTIVALHRAVHLARTHDDARVLLTTFSDPLAQALRIRLRRLISSEPRLGERVEVEAIDTFARRLYERNIGPLKLATRTDVDAAIAASLTAGGEHRLSRHFIRTEWEEVIDAWQIASWDSYRDVPRLGRKTRLPEKQRQVLWSIFGNVRARLEQNGLLTLPQMYARLTEYWIGRAHRPFDFIVVDEAQDLSVAQMRFLAAWTPLREDSLFFAGDLGQRIFQQPFSWKALGVDIRGRSRTLRINYRTSHQIRRQADRLLAATIVDLDGNEIERKGTTSVFNGPDPAVQVFNSEEDEIAAVAAWVEARFADAVAADELAVFVRSPAQFERATAAVVKAGPPVRVLDDRVATATGHVSVCTMHLAKGLEFKAVVVMACDDDVLPLQERIESVADDADLEEVYATERHLLYVACTRARDHLLVTGVRPASEFLEDLVS